MALVTVPRLRLQHPSPDVMPFFPLPAIMRPQPARSKACFAVQVGIVCVYVYECLYKLSSRSEAVKSRLAEWTWAETKESSPLPFFPSPLLLLPPKVGAYRFSGEAFACWPSWIVAITMDEARWEDCPEEGVCIA